MMMLGLVIAVIGLIIMVISVACGRRKTNLHTPVKTHAPTRAVTFRKVSTRTASKPSSPHLPQRAPTTMSCPNCGGVIEASRITQGDNSCPHCANVFNVEYE